MKRHGHTARMEVARFRFLDFFSRSSKLRDESDRLGGISEGLLEDRNRLRHDAAERKINVENCRAKISPPAFRSYSNRP